MNKHALWQTFSSARIVRRLKNGLDDRLTVSVDTITALKKKTGILSVPGYFAVVSTETT